MKGYKVTNSDYTCRNVKFEVGQTYTVTGAPIMCQNGYHFCEKVADCFNYYSFDPNNKVLEVEATGELVKGEDKHVTNSLLVIRELTWAEMLVLANEGKGNTGIRNTGDRNTGNRNTGNSNTGNWNTGDRNTGIANSCNYSSGIFCNEEPKLIMFNKPVTGYTRNDFYNSRVYELLCRVQVSKWVKSSDMTDEEKRSNPSHTTTGGYLLKIDYKTAWREMWATLNDADKKAFTDFPNFDWSVFSDITGILND